MKSTKLTIGNVTLDNNVVLAPMAGVTDLPFRVLCKEQGAGLICMEMVSAKGIYYNNKNTIDLLQIHPDETPVSLQFFGSDPKIMSEMAKRIEDRPFSFLDINMGCPVPKVVNNHEGSALMKEPKLAAEIVRSIANAIDKPVTVKIRKGFDDDHINAVELAKRLEDAGAAAIAVHGRTREQYYSGKADWEIIRQVKQAVTVPVIGNGDIFSVQDGKRMLEETGCDFLMVGRAAMGNPWIFAQINAYLNDGVVLPTPPLSKRLLTLIDQVDRMVEYKGEKIALMEARKHAAWYMRGLKGAAELRRLCGMINSKNDVLEIVKKAMELNA